MSDPNDEHRNDGEQARGEGSAGNGPDREGWETRAVFRETYLSLYAEPEIRAAYRRVGIAIYEGALAREETYANRGESPVAADLRAAARDLRVSQGVLTRRIEAALGPAPSREV